MKSTMPASNKRSSLNAIKKSKKTSEIAIDLNPKSKPTGLRKPNAGFAKHYVFITDDLFEEDLKA